MRKNPHFFILILILFFSFNIKVFAYDAKTTHLKLTEIAVDFYNLFGSFKINETEKQLMMKGAKEEDDNLRFINHFYDPIFNKTWHFLGVENVFPEVTAKEWAQNPLKQAVYDPIYLASIGPVIKSPVFSQTNFTWQKAIYEYVKGDRFKVFITLGHILHLIQDMSVPEHTRENAHLSFLDKATSYYENYTATLDDNFYLPLKNELKNYKEYIQKEKLDNFFDFLALYSNNYFFSPDTLPPSKYKLPEVLYPDVPEINSQGEIEYFLMGVDENNNLFHLAKKNFLDWRLQSGFSSYTLNDSKVLNDYFKKLSLKSVLVSSGVIDLFFKQAEKAKLDPNFVKKNEKNLVASIFEGINSFISDIFQKEPEYILKEEGQNDSLKESDNLNSSITTTAKSVSPLTTLNTTTTLKTSNTTSSTSTPKLPTTTKSTTTTLKTQTTTTTKLQTTTTTKSPLTTTTKSSNTTPLSFCSFNTLKTPLRNKIIFNEIAWMGGIENANHEWLELKNISNETIDLSNWQILDKESQIKIIFPLGFKIDPNQLLLLERTSDNSVPNTTADLIYTGALSNSNEGLRLFDSQCNLMDEVFAENNWPAGDNDSKRTMERKADLTWQTSLLPGGTPRRENSSGYVVVTSSGSSNSNPSSQTTTTTTVTLTTTTLPNEPISYPKILINEIKIAGKNSNGEIMKKDEFIELYNPNEVSVDLTNWYLQKRTQNGSSYTSLVTKSVLEGKVINPKSYFVIGNILSFSSSSYDALFSEDYTLAENNTIVLKNPNGEIVDKVGYGEVSDFEESPTINPEPQKSIQRKKVNDKPIDTDDNLNDFELLDCPTPKEIFEQCVLGETTQNELSSNPYIKNFSWHYFDESKSKVIIEFDIDNYPFVSNTTTTINSFFALAFYLNSEVPYELDPNGDYNAFLGNRDFWGMDSNYLGLVLKYPDCQGQEGIKSALIFTSDEGACHAPGMPFGSAYNLFKLPSNNHFIIEVKGTNQNQDFKDFSLNDYLTIGVYSYYPYNYALRLIYKDKNHYYFDSSKFYHPPSKIENFEVSFSPLQIITTSTSSSSVLYFSFDEAFDEDLNDSLSYEILYAFKKEGDSLENNDLTRYNWSWPSSQKVNGNLIYNSLNKKYYLETPLSLIDNLNLPVNTTTTIYFAVRAKDKVDLISPLSSIKEITLLPPPPPPNILSTFIQNVNWYFGSDDKIYVEFDIVKNGQNPYGNFKYKILTGVDYEPGAGFLVINLGPNRIFLEPRRLNRNYSSGDLKGENINEFMVFNINNYPSLGHYQVSPYYFCLPDDGNFLRQCYFNNKNTILEELRKRNKNLENLYLFMAYGVCDRYDYGCVWFNSDDLENPTTFPLTPN